MSQHHFQDNPASLEGAQWRETGKMMGGLVSGEEEGREGEAGDEMRQRLQAGFKPTMSRVNGMHRAHWVKLIFKELTTTQWAERQIEDKLGGGMIMPSHYFISSIALIHCLWLDCEYKGICMPIQRYVTYMVWIHLSEFIIVRKKTQGGWNVNSP